MAREVGTEKAKPVFNCDICHGKKGHNREVYHILLFDDFDSLKAHLKSVFAPDDYCVEFYTTMFVTAHQIYGQRARDLYQPLWLVYLEVHGVKVPNRGDAIMRHRGQLLIEPKRYQ